jgi:hypothetical protein
MRFDRNGLECVVLTATNIMIARSAYESYASGNTVPYKIEDIAVLTCYRTFDQISGKDESFMLNRH